MVGESAVVLADERVAVVVAIEHYRRAVVADVISASALFERIYCYLASVAADGFGEDSSIHVAVATAMTVVAVGVVLDHDLELDFDL